MSRLIERLNKDVFSLIVLLPEISVSFARAAESSGADAICVRFDAEKDKSELIELVKAVKVPVGIMFDDGSDVLAERLAAFAKFGFDFIDAKPEVLKRTGGKPGSGRVGRLLYDFDIEAVSRFSDGDLDAVDAAIIDPETFGGELTVGDLQQYITLSITSRLPVIVPAQKTIRVSEIPIVWDTGAKAIMLDAAITGDSLNTFKTVVAEYKNAVAALKEQ